MTTTTKCLIPGCTRKRDHAGLHHITMAPKPLLNQPALNTWADKAELEWWRTLATKITMDSDMPRVGATLTGRRYRLTQVRDLG